MKYKASQRTPDLGDMLKSKRFRDLVMDAAEHGAEAVRAAVPRDTGQLAQSIEVHYEGENGGSKGDRAEARIVATAPHAAAVQFGTRHRRAQPFLEAGIEAIEGTER